MQVGVLEVQLLTQFGFTKAVEIVIIFGKRQIYKTSLRGAKSNIKPSEAISYTKALSEGFTAERNDKLVAKPPKRMKNNGFLKPR